MKLLVVMMIFLLSLSLYCEEENTLVSYEGIKDSDLLMISEMMDIQLQHIVCRDTTMRGKRFLLHMDHFKDGKIVEDFVFIDYSPQSFPYGKDPNGNTIYYSFDPGEKAIFREDMDRVKFSIGVKRVDSLYAATFKLPGFFLNKDLVADGSYYLRSLSCEGGSKPIAVDSGKIPILSFSPPTKQGSI